MKPIDYLRAMAKRNRKPAIGGLVNAQWRPTETEGCTLTIDNSESRFTQPAGLIRFDGELTEEQAQEIRERFQQINDQPEQPAPVPGPAPGERAVLPTLGWTNPVHTNGACVHDVIYSSCNCPATNIRTQTKTAGFHADQA